MFLSVTCIANEHEVIKCVSASIGTGFVVVNICSLEQFPAEVKAKYPLGGTGEIAYGYTATLTEPLIAKEYQSSATFPIWRIAGAIPKRRLNR